MIVGNDWVPTAAFIEHYVLEEALSKDVSISMASMSVLPGFGLLPNGPFLHRQTRLLGMLYVLLVFPRERWKRDGLLDIIVERAKVDNELAEANGKLLSSGFLRSLRNAVAHARIDFADDSVTFRDGRSDSIVEFEVTLSVRDAVNLLLVLGRAFHESAQIKGTLSDFERATK